MITEFNYFQMIPAVWSIAAENDVDVGVARSMLKNNIRLGRAEDPMGKLPDAFTPDWATLQGQYEAKTNHGAYSDFNIFCRVANTCYFQLCQLWKEKDYQGMIDLMVATEDPGPIGRVDEDGDGVADKVKE